MKLTNDGGTVDILVSPYNQSSLRLQVRDTGIGIKAEDFGKLFTEFQQLDSGTDRRYEGTGLGLALTRKIVELQKGTIGSTRSGLIAALTPVRASYAVLVL